MWVKALFKSDPKINPNFALNMPTYNKTTAVHSFHPTVIHATYLYSDLDVDTQFQLHFDGTVNASTLTGLPLHTLLDTGCHKTLLSKKVYDHNIKHFQNYYEIPFLEKHSDPNRLFLFKTLYFMKFLCVSSKASMSCNVQLVTSVYGLPV